MNDWYDRLSDDVRGWGGNLGLGLGIYAGRHAPVWLGHAAAPLGVISVPALAAGTLGYFGGLAITSALQYGADRFAEAIVPHWMEPPATDSVIIPSRYTGPSTVLPARLEHSNLCSPYFTADMSLSYPQSDYAAYLQTNYTSLSTVPPAARLEHVDLCSPYFSSDMNMSYPQSYYPPSLAADVYRPNILQNLYQQTDFCPDPGAMPGLFPGLGM